MKYGKIFRILVVAVIISWLALVIPTAPTAAGTYLNVSPTSGRAGDTITVTITGLAGNTVVLVFNDVGPQTVNITSSSYTTSYTIPTSATPGGPDGTGNQIKLKDYGWWMSGAPGYIEVATFTVITVAITLDVDEGPVGTEVEIIGTDFNDGEDVTIDYDDTDITDDIVDGGTSTNSNGDFTSTISIPESTTGSHTITVTGATSASTDTASFTVESEASLSPTEGGAGTWVTVSGTGFKASLSITITSGDEELDTTIETDTNGSFSGAFTVPTEAQDTYEVEISDGTNSHSFNFDIPVGASLDLATGNIGTTLTMSGNSFLANGAVTVKYDDTLMATTTAAANGDFEVIFEVPASQSGGHTIIVSDGTNTKQFIFTMESEAPPIPPPLLPEDTDKTKAKIYFDWDDVTDPSGVTYTFQIATDNDFTSIVLEEKGLTSSEYTITAEKKLEPVGDDESYYWRVKAVDGASNESEWTLPGSFHFGSQLVSPSEMEEDGGITEDGGMTEDGGWMIEGWLLYTAIGVGAFLCGLIGFWIGRRTAYSSYY